MSKTFTPGPLVVEPAEWDNDDYTPQYLICETPAMPGKNDIACAVSYPDALLFSAAPDLYAALEGLVNATLYEVKCQRLDLAMVETEIAVAMAAISKARGEGAFSTLTDTALNVELPVSKGGASR